MHLYHELSADDLLTYTLYLDLYQFMQMYFNLRVSQDVYQMCTDQIIEQCPGVIAICDDIAGCGKTEEEYDSI